MDNRPECHEIVLDITIDFSTAGSPLQICFPSSYSLRKTAVLSDLGFDSRSIKISLYPLDLYTMCTQL